MINERLKKAIKRTVKNMNADHSDWLQDRAKLHARMQECKVDGMVTILEAGRDCDGIVYSGVRHVIKAHVLAFDRLDEELNNWADGPYGLRVATPDEAAEARYQSRDTFAEAAGY